MVDVVAAGVRSLLTGALTQSLVSVVTRRMERRAPVLPLYREVGDVSSKISGGIMVELPASVRSSRGLMFTVHCGGASFRERKENK